MLNSQPGVPGKKRGIVGIGARVKRANRDPSGNFEPVLRCRVSVLEAALFRRRPLARVHHEPAAGVTEVLHGLPRISAVPHPSRGGHPSHNVGPSPRRATVSRIATEPAGDHYTYCGHW